MPALKLKDVTVCAADCLHPDLAGRALDICVDKVDFADAVLFSNSAVNGRFRCELIPPLRSSDDYSRFCLQELSKRIKTKFALVVQWDGYVVDPSAWTREFLRYDYIGAPGFLNREDRHRSWTVLNGGFSLRSRRLLDATTTLPTIPGVGEDVLICTTFRETLQRDCGVRFPPETVADRFSYQQRDPIRSTFGFHGIYNLHRVEDDDAVLAILARLSFGEQTRGAGIFNLLHLAIRDGRLELARRIYAPIRRKRSPSEMVALLSSIVGGSEGAQSLVGRLEALEAPPSEEGG